MRQTIALSLGQTIRLKKPHPCGSHDWEITRLGADIGLKCLGCGRYLLIPRAILEHKIKGKEKPQ